MIEHACRITAETIRIVSSYAAPGVTTKELDRIAEDFILSRNGIPAFKGYVVDGKKFPGSICASIDEEVVHGIPSERKLVEGQILSVDIGVYKGGFYGDSATTVAIGKISEEKEKLMRVTNESLMEGILAATDGAMTFDIGNAVQTYVESHGFSVVRDLCGHGVAGQNYMRNHPFRTLFRPRENGNFTAIRCSAKIKPLRSSRW